MFTYFASGQQSVVFFKILIGFFSFNKDQAMSASDILARAAAKGLYSLSAEGGDLLEGETVDEAVERKMKRKSPRNKQKSIQKLIRSSKSSHAAEAGHGHHANRNATSPTRKPVKKTKPVKTASKYYYQNYYEFVNFLVKNKKMVKAVKKLQYLSNQRRILFVNSLNIDSVSFEDFTGQKRARGRRGGGGGEY